MKYVGGVDPGLNGSAAILDQKGSIVKTYVMEKQVSGGIDLESLCTFIATVQKEYKNITWYVEDVHALFGSSAKSTFNFGKVVGNIHACLVCNGAEFKLITPRKWQIIWQPEDVVLKENGRKDTKLTSLNCAKRLYPAEKEVFIYGSNEKITGRKSRFNDGIVDSILIARSQIGGTEEKP